MLSSCPGAPGGPTGPGGPLPASGGSPSDPTGQSSQGGSPSGSPLVGPSGGTLGTPFVTGGPAPISPAPLPATASVSPAAGGQGPCPGQGYSCDDCPDGWFCPPPQTPAQPAPCGYGWPCYHCSHSWFCAPQPSTVTMCPSSQASVASVQATGTSPQQATLPTASMTTFVTSSPSFHPATGGWSYAGCYRDDPNRSLKDYSVLAPVAGGMTNDKCIGLCRANNFSIAGTEDGFQCFCGNALVDSMLLDDTRCNMTCDGGSARFCGGAWALSLWSADGKVSQENGPQRQFTLPRPAPGSPDVSVHPGGIMLTVVPLTTALDMWPPPVPSTMTSALPTGSSTVTGNGTDGLLSISSGYPAPASDRAVAAESPTEPGLFSGWTGVVTSNPKVRYFSGRYRGAMPFVA